MVGLLRAIPHVGPVPRAQEPMPSDTLVPDPPRGGVLHRLPLLGGNRRRRVRQGLPEAGLQGRLARGVGHRGTGCRDGCWPPGAHVERACGAAASPAKAGRHRG